MNKIWNPTTKMLLWGIFGLGSIILVIDGLSSPGFDWWRIFEGALFGALSVVMIRYALRERRGMNAYD